jgi:glycosyltransferase involved in cell wall biosynthesis
MKILQVHNYYAQSGGEDVVVATEREHLEAHGHDIRTYYVTNENLQPPTGGGWRAHITYFVRLIYTSIATVWNPVTYRRIRRILQTEKPEVVHCHNIFPRISPSIYWACAREGVPVAQTLHNYRLLCLNAYLFRFHNTQHTTGESSPRDQAGSICHLCSKRKWKWPGIKYHCYRNSQKGSAIVALMLGIHHLLGTWRRKVDLYITLSNFQLLQFTQSGWPESHFVTKPNPVNRLAEITSSTTSLPLPQPFALFVGRITPEKGLGLLLHAWKEMKRTPLESRTCPHLVIAGIGPFEPLCRDMIHELGLDNSVHMVGKQNPEQVQQMLRKATCLVSPSSLYETFGLVVAEAAMQGVPSIVAAPGAASELVDDSKTGLLCPREDVLAWANALRWAFEHPGECQKMGHAACERLHAAASSQQAVDLLVKAYDQAIQNASERECQGGRSGASQPPPRENA